MGELPHPGQQSRISRRKLPRNYREPQAYKSNSGKDEDIDVSTPIKVYSIPIVTIIVVREEDVKGRYKDLRTRSSKRRNSFNPAAFIDKLLFLFLYIIYWLQKMNLSFFSEQIMSLFLLVVASIILLLLVIIAFRLLTQKTKQRLNEKSQELES